MMNRKFVWIATLAVVGVNLAVTNDADAQLLRRLLGRDCCCTPCETTCCEMTPCETSCVTACAPCASPCATPVVAQVSYIETGCGCAQAGCGCGTPVACGQVSYGQGVACGSGCGEPMVGAGCPQGGCGGTVVVEGAAPATLETSPKVEAPAAIESAPEAPSTETAVEGDREA